MFYRCIFLLQSSEIDVLLLSAARGQQRAVTAAQEAGSSSSPETSFTSTQQARWRRQWEKQTTKQANWSCIL